MATDRLFDQSFMDRYSVEKSLGSGGAGQVFKAKQKDLERFVAIKFINPRMFKDAEAVARFRQEGEIASRLVHPNIVQVYDIGESNNYPYIVYELVEGKDLAEHIQRLGSIDPHDAMGMMEDITSGLALAHENEIIHRDLKAENILIDSNGKVKLADFGIAKAQTSGIKTETGVVLGTPSYMSPEQVRGERVTPASDIYSLGVIFFEMLTGRLPFWAKSPMETALKHLHEEPPRLDIDCSPTLRTRLDRMIRERMLAKDVRDRYQTAGEFLSRLRDLRAGKTPMGEVATKSFHVDDEGTKPIARDEVTQGQRAPRDKGESTRAIRAGQNTVAQSKAGTKAIERDKIGKTTQKTRIETSSRNRIVVLSLVFLVVFVFSLSAWLVVKRADNQLPEGANYDVLDSTCESGYYEATLNWRSTIAYPTVVEIWPKEKRDDGRRVASPGERDAVTRHTLKIEDLQEATIYEYRIVFPDGNKSFQKQLTTKGFRLISCKAHWQGPGLFHVDIKTVNQHQVRLVVNLDKEVIHEEKSRGIHSEHHFEVRVEQFHRKLTYDVFFYKEAGAVTPTKFLMKQPLGAYTEKMEAGAKILIEGVNACHLRKTINSFEGRNIALEERRRIIRELIESRQDELGKKIAAFAEHAKFYFESSTIEPSSRQALYEAFTEVEEFNHYASLLGLSSSIPLSFSIGGEYSLDYHSRTSPTFQSVKVKFETLYQSFDDYTLIPVQPPPGREIKPLVIERLSGVTRAQMDIEVEGLTGPSIFIFRLNSSSVYRLRRRKDGMTHFCQAIDPRVLNEGNNSVDFAVEVLPGFERPTKVRIVKASLALDRRR